MTTQVYLVKPDDVQDLWFGVRPLIEKPLEHSEGAMTSSDVLRAVITNKFQLWVGFDRDEIDTVLITQIISYPRHKILRIHTWATSTGYDFDIWYKDCVEALESFARYHDCTALEAWCRKGLARKLKWHNEYSVVVKPIKQGEPDG